MDAAAIRARFPGDAYVAFHAPRYAALLDLLAPMVSGSATTILDIGNSPFTALAAERFGTRIDNLGLHGEFDTPHGQSYWYDLNQTQDSGRWRTDLGPYDVIVMAEVIEHLYTAPQIVLAYLRSLLVPGGVLIVQTPNAAALQNRLLLLAGRNPFELIREDRDSNPGHFREYTRAELLAVCIDVGFTVAQWSGETYFDYRHYPDSAPIRRVGGALNACYRVLPPTWRPGQTAVLHS